MFPLFLQQGVYDKAIKTMSSISKRRKKYFTNCPTYLHDQKAPNDDATKDTTAGFCSRDFFALPLKSLL